MRVARWHGQRDVRVDDVDEPALDADAVRIDVTAAGICGTDLHEYADGPDFLPAPGDPHPLSGVTPPVPLGHEFSGTVAEVGADVTAVSVGDPVTVNPAVVCEDCRYCRAGDHHLCPDVANIGLGMESGGFAESVVAPEGNVVGLPPDLPVELGALVEPYAVGLHAVRRSALDAGDSVAVFGCGPIGLTILEMARVAGAGEIFVSEPRAGRRALAADLGADVTLDPRAGDAVETVREATDGGVDVAFEAAGVTPTYTAAIESTRHGGEILTVGIAQSPVDVVPKDIAVRERSIVGSNGYLSGPRGREEFGAVVDRLAAGDCHPGALVTGRISLDDIVDGGFEALLGDDGDHVKILVEP
ncbi:2,3-butanediol dehydrogenase [Haloarcula onubensis]|uniref:2,3-butanediol dehydrogenase n=1 Tax=Haloarcula onubensis TaxID=2950539 RepID=A0ABU2FNQ7_9EURY|nr:2,3-butanediol dehydrogenase [Halomicroarcula sp. S3CR25-11]MDS0281921.1 2,3-butanediol dehydrogenase [Halomicroarcula sp. S3CR25-11]